jgi:hypothetical protein
VNAQKRLALITAGLTALGGFAVAGAASASAAVPSCVSSTYSAGQTFPTQKAPKVTVKNNCSSTQRVQVAWSISTDSKCFVLAPGGSAFSSASNTLAQFQGLKSC